MARVVAFIPDLLFGSNVMGSLQAAGHDVVLAADARALAAAVTDGEVLIVDLTSEAAERIDAVARLRTPGLPVLGFYSHVESDVRAQAQRAGFDQVVPRSRMAREGAALIEPLLAR